jgi:hypothetical protein
MRLSAVVRSQLLALSLLLVIAAPAAAQRATRGDSIVCWDCDRAKQPIVAFFEAQIGVWPAFAYNKWGRDGGISDVGLRFWRENTFGRWDWDPNSFDINQIGHPLQGSLYYNGFRTNGYGFWTSQAASLAGSFLWECCGERNLPSINDLLTTWMGGATLGEVSRRVSDLALDNTATGGHRFVRELGAGLVNPVRGIDRVIRGHAWKRGANAPDAHPEWLQGQLGVGALALGSDRSGDDVTQTGAKVDLRLVYGDYDALVGKPFSHFAIDVELTSIPETRLYLIRGRGSLFGKVIDSTGANKFTLAGFARYDYVRSRAFELGAQSVSVGLTRQWVISERTKAVTNVNLRAVPIAAVEDELVDVSGEGRNYDYGYGVGSEVDVMLTRTGVGMIRTAATVTAIRTADGVATSHLLERHEISGLLELSSRFAVSVGGRYQKRRSYFDDQAHTAAASPEAWVSLVTALPRWRY